MGDRGNVQIVYSNGQSCFLYTHRSGSELDRIVANALKRGEGRWHDEQYLARIIFSEMLLDLSERSGDDAAQVLQNTTGFGISPYRGDYNREDVVVNVKTQEVYSKDAPDGDFGAFAEWVRRYASK